MSAIRTDDIIAKMVEAMDRVGVIDFDTLAEAAFYAAFPVIIERCAKIAEGFPKNRGWVPGSLYDTLRREVAADIRSLTTHSGEVR